MSGCKLKGYSAFNIKQKLDKIINDEYTGCPILYCDKCNNYHMKYK